MRSWLSIKSNISTPNSSKLYLTWEALLSSTSSDSFHLSFCQHQRPKPFLHWAQDPKLDFNNWEEVPLKVLNGLCAGLAFPSALPRRHHKCKGSFAVIAFDDLWLLCRRFLAMKTSWRWNLWGRKTRGNMFVVLSFRVLEQGRRRCLLLSMVSCVTDMSLTQIGPDATPTQLSEALHTHTQIWILSSGVNSSKKKVNCHKVSYFFICTLRKHSPLWSFFFLFFFKYTLYFWKQGSF